MANQRVGTQGTNAEWMTETEAVLRTLQVLLQGVTSPVVRACLEEAHEDIVHLTSSDPQAEQEERIAA